MSSAENLQVWVDEFGEGVLALFMPFPVPSGDQVLRRLNGTTPTISGTGAVGTLHTAVSSTWSVAPPPITYEWLINSVVVAVGATYTPPNTIADKTPMQVRESVPGLPSLTMDSPTKTIINAVTIPWPANLASSKVLKIGEITDPDDPNVGTGTRREIQMDTFTIPTGFSFWVNSSPLDGAQMAGASQLTGAGGTAGYKRWNNALPIGDETWITGFWKYDATGDSQRAFAKGTTGDGKTLTEVLNDTTHGQLAVTIAGITDDPDPPVSDWPTIPTAARTDALAIHAGGTMFGKAVGQIKYFDNPGNTGNTNCQQFGHSSTTLAMCAYHGDTSVWQACREQKNTFLVPGNQPLCTGGVGAQHENYFISFFTILRESTWWTGTWVDAGVTKDNITATEKSQVSCVLEAMMYDACYMGSDNHPSITIGTETTQRTLRGTGHTQKSVGGDISFGIISRLQSCAAWFGVAVARGMVENFDMSDFRAKCLTTLGSSSSVYRTFNWRLGGHNSDTDNITGGLSSNCPTDAQVEACLGVGFRYYGSKFDEFERQLTSGGSCYMEKMLPPYRTGVGANQKYWGRVQYGLNNNVGVNDGTGAIRGIIANPSVNGPLTPHLSPDYTLTPAPGVGEQRMWFNLNGQDGGKGKPERPTLGPNVRSSMTYTAWDVRMFEHWCICMEMNGAWDRTTPGMLDLLQKSFDAMDVYLHFNACGYNSYSHGGYEGGGAGGPEVWTAGGIDYYHMGMNLAISDVVRGKLGY